MTAHLRFWMRGSTGANSRGVLRCWHDRCGPGLATRESACKDGILSGPPKRSQGINERGTGSLGGKTQRTMKRKRRPFSAEFKARVALEAIKSLNEIEHAEGVLPVQVSVWKNELQLRSSANAHRRSRVQSAGGSRREPHPRQGQTD